MIDIHSHILYGVDDGSESREMSLEMLRMSEASGVTDIFATPHVNRKGLVPDWTDLQAKAADLQRAADEAGIHLGDVVAHPVFGQGVVIEQRPGGSLVVKFAVGNRMLMPAVLTKCE